MWSQGNIEDISDTKNLNRDNIDLENALSLAENLVWELNLNLNMIIKEVSHLINLLNLIDHGSLVSYASFQYLLMQI